jgi:glutamate racemase
MNDDFFIKKPIVGVVGGTYFDTALGASYLKEKGMNVITYPISQSPLKQTILQTNQQKLTMLLRIAIHELIESGVSCIFIYCNSLSGVADIMSLEDEFNLPIITPFKVYHNIANSFDHFGLITANCQGAASIEKTFLNCNTNCTITNFSNLKLVEYIEKGEYNKPSDIINDFKLLDQVKVFIAFGCQALIIGCTHFSIFSEELLFNIKELNINLKLIDPTKEMVKQVIDVYYDQDEHLPWYEIEHRFRSEAIFNKKVVQTIS